MYCSVEAVCNGGWGGQLLPGEVVCYFQSIVSTSCGSGVIGAGCCRLYGVRGGEGSQHCRQESGHTHSTSVAGQQLAYLASLTTFISMQSLDSSEPGKETIDVALVILFSFDDLNSVVINIAQILLAL